MGGHLSSAAVVPELGPALGRLILPADAPGRRPAGALDLSGVRLALVTAVFEGAGEARAALSAGQGTRARELLAPVRWEQWWGEAAAAAAAQLRLHIDAAIGAAGRRSGYPPGRLRRELMTDDEAAGVALRLRAAGVPLGAPLSELGRAPDHAAWSDALIRSARALEESWAELEASVRDEEEAWEREPARIGAWRPARWPRWVAAGVVLTLTTWIGLVLGGYLPVPRPLTPAARAWWTRVEP